jgi:hypothetical protein
MRERGCAAQRRFIRSFGRRWMVHAGTRSPANVTGINDKSRQAWRREVTQIVSLPKQDAFLPALT